MRPAAFARRVLSGLLTVILVCGILAAGTTSASAWFTSGTYFGKPFDEGASITQSFNNYYATMKGYHSGEDWNVPNRKVYAVAGGNVVFCRDGGDYGWTIAIKHNGYFSAYTHVVPQPGIGVDKPVTMGQHIAMVATAQTTSTKKLMFGAHLHWEMAKDIGQGGRNWLSDMKKPANGYYASPQATLAVGYVAPSTFVPPIAVTYNANGGINPPAPQFKWNDATLTLSTAKPTRSNHVFMGWSTNAGAATAQYQPGANYNANADVMLYAVWKPIYTIVYNANGGVSPPPPQTKQHDIALTLSTAKPTRTDYIFQGWSPSPSVTALLLQPGGKYTGNSNITLYAIWAPGFNIYEVTYNTNGTGVTNMPGTQTKKSNIPLTLSTTKPNRPGYTFQGWATSALGPVLYQPGAGYIANAKLTLFAVWKPVTYDVIYNANGTGVTNMPASPQKKTHGANLALSGTKPARSGGYTFQGWSTSAAGQVQYQSGGTYSANANATLYAVWKKLYAVTYHLNGGSGGSAFNIAKFAMPQPKTPGVALTLYAEKPTRSGYTFMGWATSSGAKTAQYQPGGKYTNDANVTLYAVWIANTYTVTYNANGGSGAPGKQTKTHGVNLALSGTKPTRDKYAFKGWATSSTTGTAQYQPGGNYTANANVTLYAVWGWKDVTSQFAGKRVTIQSKQWGNRYLSAWEYESGAPVYARVSSYSNPSINKWETFTVTFMNAAGTVGLKANNGKYLRVNADNANEHAIKADGAKHSNWESFRIMQYGNSYAIQVYAEGKYSYKGSWLTVNNAANNPVRANRNLKTPQAWECLTITIR